MHKLLRIFIITNRGMEEFESEAVLERLVSYIYVFCSRHSHATVKVSEIFRNDAEALKLMMGNKYVREQCKCKFQGGGKWRELVVQPLSEIRDCHVDMISQSSSKESERKQKS